MSIIFEHLVNIFQSVVVVIYMIKCMPAKKYNKITYAVGCAITLVYLEILNEIKIFEGTGIFIYLVISIIYSVLLLEGRILGKFIYNILLICSIVCSALLGSGIIGIISNLSFGELSQFNSADRYFAVILVQIILCLMLFIIVKFRDVITNNNSQNIVVFGMVPIVSVIMCNMIVYSDAQGIYIGSRESFLIIIGILILNAVSVIMLIMQNKAYMKRVEEQILLRAYQQKEREIESIIAINEENNKFRHEFINMVTLINDMLDNKEYEKIKDVLGKYSENTLKKEDLVIYTHNIVLNYLLNRKIAQCKEKDIDIRMFINGDMNIIDDIDMYILLENLMNNAIEACFYASNPQIYLQMDSDRDRHKLGILLTNSTKDEYIHIVPERMKTTKEDKNNHGYGLKNISDVINKYHGSIIYKNKIPGMIECCIELHGSNN